MSPAPTIGRNVLWHLDAACATGTTDPELFYPLDLDPHGAAVAAAKRVCAGCPVRAQCLTEVMAAEDPARRWGITAGTTPAERAALHAASRPAAAQIGTRAGMRPGTGSTVNARLTPDRRGRRARVVENAEFAAFGRRVLRAAGRRVAAGDVDALPALAALSVELDAAITDAVTGLRAAGYSWAEIATRLGVTRQAAHQRWSTGPADPAAQGVA